MKIRSKPGFSTNYLVNREGDKIPFEVFDTKEKADAACKRFNAACAAYIIIPETGSQTAAQATA